MREDEVAVVVEIFAGDREIELCSGLATHGSGGEQTWQRQTDCLGVDDGGVQDEAGSKEQAAGNGLRRHGGFREEGGKNVRREGACQLRTPASGG